MQMQMFNFLFLHPILYEEWRLYKLNIYNTYTESVNDDFLESRIMNINLFSFTE